MFWRIKYIPRQALIATEDFCSEESIADYAKTLNAFPIYTRIVEKFDTDDDDVAEIAKLNSKEIILSLIHIYSIWFGIYLRTDAKVKISKLSLLWF